MCVFQKKLPSDSEVVCKPDLVYTVSAREYWQGNTLSKEETGNSELYACDICAWSWVKATRSVFGIIFARTLLVWWLGTDAFFPLPSSFESVPLSCTLLGKSPGCPHGSAGPTRVLGASCVPLHPHPTPGRTSADPNQAIGAAEMSPEHPQGCQGLLEASSSEATTRLELVSWVSCRRAAPLLTRPLTPCRGPEAEGAHPQVLHRAEEEQAAELHDRGYGHFLTDLDSPVQQPCSGLSRAAFGSIAVYSFPTGSFPSSRQFTSHISSTTRTQPAGKTSRRGLTNASRQRSLKYPQPELISCSLPSQESPGLSSCPPGQRGQFWCRSA